MRHWVVISTLFFCIAAAHSQQHAGFERKIYNIYQQTYSKEVSDTDWRLFLKYITRRVYQVKEGDTLWGLSKVFFGDGFFWPKIWSYNQKLTNPHLIRVGQSIQFYAGSLEEAPGVGVKGQTDSTPTVLTNKQEESPQQAVKTSGLYLGTPQIPPSRRPIRPVLKQLPASFTDSPPYQSSMYDDKGMSLDLRRPIPFNPLVEAQSFLYGRDASKYPRVGEVIEAENNERLIGLNQKVYIRSEQPLKIGEILTVMGRQYRFGRNGYGGDVIQYQARVEISESVDENIYRATIVQSLAGVKGQPWVSREAIPRLADDYVGRSQSTKLPIIGGGLDNGSRVFGQGDVIFLGGGVDKGVRVGDVFGVYKRRDKRYSDSTVARSPVPIAHIKVFRAEPTTTSAFVMSSSEAIIPGDETGEPGLTESSSTTLDIQDLGDTEWYE